MGFPKQNLIHSDSGLTLLEWQVRKWKEHVQTVFVVGGQKNDVAGAVSIVDPSEFQGDGPLAGLLAACEHTSSDYIAIVAVDCPNFPPSLFSQAVEQAPNQWDVLLYRDRKAKVHWLCSVWKSSLKSEIRQELVDGQRAVKRFASKLKVQIYDLPAEFDDSVFLNLNRVEDLAEGAFINKK